MTGGGSDGRRRPHRWLDALEMAPVRRDFTLEHLGRETAAAGIDRAILVRVLPKTDETAEFLALAARTDLVAGVVGWADLTLNRLSGTPARPAGSVLR